MNPYDINNMHTGATVLSLVGFVFTLFPATATIGVIVSVGASGFDLGQLYSEWNYADEVVSKAGFFYQIKNFIEYLDKKIRKGE